MGLTVPLYVCRVRVSVCVSCVLSLGRVPVLARLGPGTGRLRTIV